MSFYAPCVPTDWAAFALPIGCRSCSPCRPRDSSNQPQSTFSTHQGSREGAAVRARVGTGDLLLDNIVPFCEGGVDAALGMLEESLD